MKIEKQCSNVVVEVKKLELKIEGIPNGTVFRYGDHKCGPYLRIKCVTVDGLYNLKDNFFAGAAVFTGYDFHTGGGYLPLPNAKVVTGEV